MTIANSAYANIIVSKHHSDSGVFYSKMPYYKALENLWESKRNIWQKVMLRCNISYNSVKVVSDCADILGTGHNRMPTLHFLSRSGFTE